MRVHVNVCVCVINNPPRPLLINDSYCVLSPWRRPRQGGKAALILCLLHSGLDSLACRPARLPACLSVSLELWIPPPPDPVVRVTCLLITFTSPTPTPTFLSTLPLPISFFPLFFHPPACHKCLAPPRPPQSGSTLNFSSQGTCCLPEPKTAATRGAERERDIDGARWSERERENRKVASSS